MNPEIAKPVETFKNEFEKLTANLPLNERKELWRFFESSYVDVLISMHGWRVACEHQRTVKQKAMDVLAEVIEIKGTNTYIRPIKDLSVS